MSEWHVRPRRLDLIEHPTSDECPCGPTSQLVIRADGSCGWLVVHHSLDGRELCDDSQPEQTYASVTETDANAPSGESS